MADRKITQLTADTSPTSDDLLYVVDDVSGLPTGKKSTLSDISKGLNSANIPNTPAGNIAATNVQAAIDELDTEKAIDTAVVHTTGNETVGGEKDFTNGIKIASSAALTSVSTGTLNNDKAVTQGYVDDASVSDHGGLTGLSDDDHSQYALLAGRSGGQTIVGGTDASDNLTLSPTSDATKGNIIMGTGATQTILPSSNDANTPTLAFGDGDTGFFESGDDQLRLSVLGTNSYVFDLGGIYSGTNGSFYLSRSAATGTSPAYRFLNDSDTGIGLAGANQLSLIAGGVEGIRVNSAAAHSVAGIANYETLVTDDDDIPNKKYTDDAISTAVETKDQFTELSDTPANFTGSAGKYAKVNAGETAIEFGTISAVGVSGTKMGSWDSGDTYAAGDLVNYNGVIYKSLSANSNSQPDTNPTDWEIYTKTMVADTITEVTIDNGVQIETITLKDGNLTVPGDLTVSGTTTTINSTTLTVDDKNIELGSVDTPTDTTADGGGITLKGTTDKTIIWDNANDNFTSSEHLNIPTGKEFKINNASINTAGTLTNVAYQNQANDFGANAQSIDTISESTADTGVTIDGLKLKDAGIELGSDADGDVYYRSGGALTRLAKGTAEQVLTMNAGATAPEWADASGGLDSAENTDIDTGTETVDTFADTDADACHWHYVVKKGTNLRTGIIMGVWEATGDTVEYNEQTTNDIGDTSDLTFAVDINADQVRLQATTLSDDWSVKVKRIQI